MVVLFTSVACSIVLYLVLLLVPLVTYIHKAALKAYGYINIIYYFFNYSKFI